MTLLKRTRNVCSRYRILVIPSFLTMISPEYEEKNDRGLKPLASWRDDLQGRLWYRHDAMHELTDSKLHETWLHRIRSLPWIRCAESLRCSNITREEIDQQFLLLLEAAPDYTRRVR